jgi:TatA/E family protein of Tat protein translocase
MKPLLQPRLESACIGICSFWHFLLVRGGPGVIYFLHPLTWIPRRVPSLRSLNAIPPCLLPSGEPFMFGLGVPELLVVMVIGLLLFGKNLPTLARSLGKSLVEFQRGVKSVTEEVNSGLKP